MKCSKCGTENIDCAKFCRCCGHELVENTDNIMDKYPLYNFVPTNLIYWKRPFTAKIISALSFFVFIISFLGLLGSYYMLYRFIFFGFLMLITGTLSYRLNKKKPSKMMALLRELADYIEDYSYIDVYKNKKSPKLKFFVKEGKFGLMDVASYIPFLPAKYDLLAWHEKDKFLIATQNNRKFIIDIYGNELK